MLLSTEKPCRKPVRDQVRNMSPDHIPCPTSSLIINENFPYFLPKFMEYWIMNKIISNDSKVILIIQSMFNNQEYSR